MCAVCHRSKQPASQAAAMLAADDRNLERNCWLLLGIKSSSLAQPLITGDMEITENVSSTIDRYLNLLFQSTPPSRQ